MLVAISGVTGQRVIADEVERGHPCQCPECSEFLIYKNGRIVTCHFAHHARTACSLSEGESVRHLQMKQQLRERFAKTSRVELEWEWVPGRRADIVLPELNIAVECQASPMAIEEWESRTCDYNRAGCAVLWVWDVSRVYGKKHVWLFPQIWPSNKWIDDQTLASQPEWRVPAEIRHCFDESGRQIFALDRTGKLAACRFVNADERENEWYDEYGDAQYSSYVPKSLKKIIPSWPSGALEHFHVSGYRLARFIEHSWSED